MKKTNDNNMMAQVMAAAKRDAMRVSMMSAKCIDIPAFVKAIGLMRQEDRYLLDGFMKSYSIYQYKYACF